MAKILVKRKAEVFEEFVISSSKTKITIGSEGGNDLVIEDKKISMNHLQIEKKGLHYYITDLRSAFGTIVNGQPVTETIRLQDGDEIQIGRHTLLFVEDEQSPVYKRPLDSFLKKEGVKFLDSEVKIAQEDLIEAVYPEEGEAVPTLEIKPEPLAWPRLPHYLLAIYGPYRGKKFQLNPGITRIGRDTKLNDIVIRLNDKGEVDSSISRRHATISLKQDGFYITDKRSKTRTYVNQRKLTDTDEAKLNPGDEIEIVSDQKSTIFRLAVEGNWNFALPKKSGVWWIRYQRPAFRLVSASVILLSLLIATVAWKHRAVITRMPQPLSFKQEVWSKNPLSESVSSAPTEVDSLKLIATPALADLNGDDLLDVVFVGPDNHLKVINGATKEPLWPNMVNLSVQYPLSPVLADLNGDDLADILVATPDSRLRALDGSNGAEIWVSQIIGGMFAGTPLVAELNGDQRKDVVVCTQEGRIVIGYGGLLEPTWVTVPQDDPLWSTPSAGDVDGDGIAEVLIGTETGNVLVFDGVERKIIKALGINEELNKAKGSFTEYNQIRAPVAIGDVNADHRADLIITTCQGNLLVLEGKTYKKLWYDVLFCLKEANPAFCFWPSLGDFDGDGMLDVVMFTLDGRIKAFKGAGKPGWRHEILWEYSPETWEKFITQPVLADLNKDGITDVVAAGVNCDLHILDGSKGNLWWKSGPSQTNPVICPPLVADLDGDNFLDILVLRSDYRLYKISTTSRFPKSSVLWGQLSGTPEHNANTTNKKLLSASSYNLKIIFSVLMLVGIVVTNLYSEIKIRKFSKS